jgi:HSP20 family protein
MSTNIENVKNEITTEKAAVQVQPAAAVRLRPAVDLLETDTEWVLHVEMPGVTHSNVNVSLEKNDLKVSGTADFSGPENARCIVGLSGPRVYERTFRLSDDISRDKIDAEVRQGILTLRLPKSQEAKKVALPVRGE